MSYLSKLTKRLALTFASAVLFTACAGTEGGGTATAPGETQVPNVASVRMLPDSVEAITGVQLRVVAEPRDEQGRAIGQQRVVWSSSDTAVASVDSLGNVTTLSDGYAEVRATVDSRTGKSRWWVRRPPVATVIVTPETAALVVGQTVELAAKPYSANGKALNSRNVTWSSTATSVATVSSTGVVTAVSAGTAQIHATIEDIVGKAEMTITSPAPGLPGTVSDVSVSATSDTSATIQFTEVTDGADDAADYEVRYSLAPISWESATPVALGSCASSVMGTTVGATRNCIVRGLTASTSYRFQLRAFRGSLGTNAVFGALSNVASGATTATIPAPVASVTLSPETAFINAGQTTTFVATARDANGNILTGSTVAWSTTNAAVATVSSAGIATAVAVGTATIRGATGGQTGSALLTVTAPTPNPVATVTLSPASATVTAGQTVTYTPTLRDAGGAVLTGRAINWSSMNTAIATVSASGVVTGVTAGTTTIRATSEGMSGDASLSVEPAPTPGSVAFASDWSYALGSTDLAIRDGGRWTRTYGRTPGAVLTVVDGAPLGWTRTPHVLRIGQQGEVSGVLERVAALPASTTHWGRLYFRDDLPLQRNDHPVSYPPVGAIQLVPFQRHGNADGVVLMLHTGNPYPFNRFGAGAGGRYVNLPHGTWYRYEWQVEYLTATTVRVWPRIYSISGELLYDASSYVQSDAPQAGTKTLAQWYAEGNVIHIADPGLARDFGLGQEGPGGAPVATGFWYFGDLALSTSGWIGQ